MHGCQERIGTCHSFPEGTGCNPRVQCELGYLLRLDAARLELMAAIGPGGDIVQPAVHVTDNLMMQFQAHTFGIQPLTLLA